MSVLVQQGGRSHHPRAVLGELPDIVKYAGGTPVIVQTRPEDGFAVRDSAIERPSLRRTRLLILNSPSIQRACGSADEYERILATCKKRNVW